MTRAIRELGYPSRQMLYYWYKEFIANGVMRKDDELGYSKYTDEQRKIAIQYYQDHGRSLSHTIKALGYPGRTVLRSWLQEALSSERTHCVAGKTLVRYTQGEREQAVIRLCTGESTAKEIAADIGATESSVYAWRRRLLSERDRASMPTKRTAERNHRTANGSSAQQDLAGEKQALIQQVEELRVEIHRLEMERDILEKAGEPLKKGQGINPETLTNREKAVLIDALRDKYRLKVLLAALGMAKSSYCYQKCAMSRPDKHAGLRRGCRRSSLTHTTVMGTVVSTLSYSERVFAYRKRSSAES